MGNSCSSLNEIGANLYLKRLCSVESLSENDPFWNAFLSYSLVDLDLVVLQASSSKHLDDAINPFCKNLSINTVKTGNFHSLVHYAINRLDCIRNEGLTEDATNPFIWQVLNSLFVIRTVCKHHIQNLSEEVIIQQFMKPGSQSDDTISKFVQSLLVCLTDIPIRDTTILLHFEMINTVITLLAMVMYETTSTVHNTFYIEIMEGVSTEQADRIVQHLLAVYAQSDKIPAFVYKEEASSLSSTLWSVMTLGMSGGPSISATKVNLGVQSVLLLLVLTNHPIADNPYRTSLMNYMSENKALAVKPEVLYETLCKDLETEQATLLLYKLLHENQVVRAFILSRSDIEKLTEPLLKVLYKQEGEESNSQHIYLTLIVLLMLTEDDGYNKDLFQMKLQTLPWYKERHLTDLSLGDAFILVIVKTMQYNMLHTKDRYLHTNCLATLANMSNKFISLHPFVCQKLIGFYSTLVRKHGKTMEKLQLSVLKAEGDDSEGELATSNIATDLGAIEEMLRMVMEIFNSCITHTVHLNLHLVHVMLCHREEFEKFRNQETFKHILQNIHTLLEYFHLKLEEQFGEQPRSVGEVLEVIDEHLKTFRRSLFLKFPDLKFKYMEETDSSRFFVPYVWQIVCKQSNLHFKPSPFVAADS